MPPNKNQIPEIRARFKRELTNAVHAKSALKAALAADTAICQIMGQLLDAIKRINAALGPAP